MLRNLAYAVYCLVLLGAYAVAAFSPDEPPTTRATTNPVSPRDVRRARLQGVSRLDAASVAGVQHAWHRMFMGPRGYRPRPTPGRSGGYYGGSGGYYGGRRSYGGGGWFGGK